MVSMETSLTVLLLHVVLLLSSAGRSDGSHISDAHLSDYRRDGNRRNKPSENSCHHHSLVLCPPDGGPDTFSYSNHVLCLTAKAAQLPKHCRAMAVDMEHCVADILNFCRDLNSEDTMHCLNLHYDQVHPDCSGSMLFHRLHREAGRDVSAYQSYYNEFVKMDERFRRDPEL